MKKIMILIILLVSGISQAEPTLYQNISASFESGSLPDLSLYSTPTGQVSAGRCVESSRPNTIHAAYFVADLISNDPFVKHTGHIQYRPDVNDEYYDDIVVPNGAISRERAPLIQQNDHKTFFLETMSKEWIFVRGHPYALLIKIQLFQQDVEVICYFPSRKPSASNSLNSF